MEFTKGVDNMQAMAQAFHTIEPAHSGSTTVKITLYELIEAIGKEVEQGGSLT